MSDFYGPADTAESVATIHAALDAGITLLDSGDYYGQGRNELLLRDALHGRRRAQVLISIKFRALRDPSGAWLGIDARPAAVENFLTYSLRRLGVSHIDIYRPGRFDPTVPIEDTVGAIGEMIKAGYVRYVGLSEVGAATLRRAHATHPISDLQIEYSLISRGIEREILPTARELGIGITAYGVLSRGLLSGHWSGGRELAPNDGRRHLPQFSQDNVDRNLQIVARCAWSSAKGATVAQAAIAWVHSRGDDIVPLVGARTRARLAEALGALDVSLTSDDLAEIERAIPAEGAAGTRYDERYVISQIPSRRSLAGPAAWPTFEVGVRRQGALEPSRVTSCRN